MPRRASDIPELPPTFWQAPTTLDALAARDVAQVLRLYQKATGASQTQIGIATGQTQADVSEIMSGARQVMSISVLTRIAEGLKMPDQAAASFLLGRTVDLHQPTSGSSHAGGTTGPVMPTVVTAQPAPPVEIVAADLSHAGLILIGDEREAEAYEVMEMVRQGDRSDLGAGTLESLQATVDRLCRSYPTMQADQLRALTKKQIQYVDQLLDSRTTISQHRELLVIAGWLYLLLGCIQLDLGNRQAAEVARDAAFHAGKEAEHPAIIRWAYEMKAWFALTENANRDVVIAARTGQEVGGEDSAMVQLILQEAKAWARLGDAPKALELLDRGRAVLDRLPEPEHAEHHFIFDPTKYAYYAAAITQWLGDDAMSEELAKEVFDRCVAPDGTTRWPMRIAETQAGMGVLAVRRGDLDRAMELGTRAISQDRKSAPSLLSRLGDIDAALRKQFPKEKMTKEFRELYLNEARRFGFEPAPLA